MYILHNVFLKDIGKWQNNFMSILKFVFYNIIHTYLFHTKYSSIPLIMQLRLFRNNIKAEILK